MRTVTDVEAYLMRAGYAFRSLGDGQTLILHDRDSSGPVLLHVGDETVIVRAQVMPLVAVGPREALYAELLRLNADQMLQAHFGVSEDAIILSCVLRLPQLDYEELVGAIDDLTLALVEQRPRLVRLAGLDSSTGREA